MHNNNNAQEKWIRRTKQLLRHLALSTTSIHDDSSMTKLNNQQSTTNQTSLLFNQLQEQLDCRLVNMFQSPQTSLNYNLFASHIGDVTSHQVVHHPFDIMNLYIPSVNFETIDNEYIDDYIATTKSLSQILIENFGDSHAFSIEQQLNTLNQHDKDNLLVELCEKLISKFQVNACRQLADNIHDKYRSTTIYCICDLKSLNLRHAIKFVETNDEYISDSLKQLVLIYSYVLLGKWTTVNKLLGYEWNDQNLNISNRDKSYLCYFKAIVYAHNNEWNECVTSCEDCIELILELFSEIETSNNIIRIQPLLLYAYSLSQCYRYEQAEIVHIEIVSKLFPKNSRGHLLYGLFLKQFRTRTEDYMKQITLSVECEDASFDAWNEYLHAILNIGNSIPQNNISQLLSTMKILENLVLSALAVQSHKTFNQNNQIIDSVTDQKQIHNIETQFRVQTEHAIQCAFILMLCARIYAIHLKLVDKATSTYEKASQVEQWCFQLWKDPSLDSSKLGFYYSTLFGCSIDQLRIAREMHQYFEHNANL
jgi:hypothetical protein